MKRDYRFDGIESLERACETLGCGSRATYAILPRGGRILLALPADRQTAARTLDLYQPQRTVAKAVKSMIHAAVACGMHWRMLPKATTTGSGNDPFTTHGFLVGSLGHQCERAVAVCRGHEGWEVIKLAFGSQAPAILAHEAGLLRELAGNHRVPNLIGFDATSETAILRMNWQEGKPWRNDTLYPILDLLNEWCRRGKAQPLREFAEWETILRGVREFPHWQHRFTTLSDMRIEPAVRHGDLTRPNLRIDERGSLLVHDWERGTLEGIPGLDLAHFLIQDELFRSRKPLDKAVAAVRFRLSCPPASDWLEQIGWHTGADVLMALVFALNTGAGYLDQTNLLNVLSMPSPTDQTQCPPHP